jgi:hypothetical protein
LAVIALGQLNLVARVVSMFFLISYGLLNYATFTEARIFSPSFRPRFKWFSKHLSLLGFLTCAGVMLAIDWRSGAVAAALLFAIYQYIKRTKKIARWADSERSYHLQQIRTHLLGAHAGPPHDTDWRPRLLVLDPGADDRERLFSVSFWLEGNSGLAIALNIHVGEGPAGIKARNENQKELSGFIQDHEWPLFSVSICAPEFASALGTLVQSVGFGPLSPNTVVLNGYEKSGDPLPCVNRYQYIQYLKNMYRFGLNLVVVRMRSAAWERLQTVPSEERRIDVWWQHDASSRLMLLFAYLMTRNSPWNKATIRVLSRGSNGNADEEKAAVQQMLEEVRIEAEPVMVESFDDDTVMEYSRESSLIFHPFSFKATPLAGLAADSDMPALVWVLAAEDLDLDAEPEEGSVALITEASDELEAAKEKMSKAEKRAADARLMVEKLNEKIVTLEQGSSAAAETDQREDLARQVKSAKAEAEQAEAHAVKAQAHAEKAEKKADGVVKEAVIKPAPKVD